MKELILFSKCTFNSHFVSVGGICDILCLFSVTNVNWMGKHHTHTSIVETYIGNNEFITATWRVLNVHFRFGRYDTLKFCSIRICHLKKTMLQWLWTNWDCVIQETFLKSTLNELGNRNNVWFQQVRARAHTFQSVMETLEEMFPSYLITLCSDIGLAHLIWISSDTRNQRYALVTLDLQNS